MRDGFCGGEGSCFDGDRGKVRDTRGWHGFSGDDEVEVIRHEGVSGDADAAFLAMRFKEAEEVFAIGVA